MLSKEVVNDFSIVFECIPEMNENINHINRLNSAMRNTRGKIKR